MERRRLIGALGSAAVVLGIHAGFTRDQSEPTSGGSQERRNNAAQAGETRTAKVDLHAHLEKGGGQQMADRYAELGFDVLVGTDHQPGGVDAETVRDYSHLEFPGPILNGAELSSDHHVNVVKSENEMIKQINHPMRYDDTADDINELAEEIGADLVETTEHGEDLAEYPTVADVTQDVEPMPTITSDAHSTEAVGRGYVVVEVEELTGDNVIRSLKRGRYSLGGDVW